MNNITESYDLWQKKVTDESLILKLNAMKGNQKAIDNAFFKDLEFGTGGLRGEIGAGTNCLNIYTIAKVTQGIADCMKAHKMKVAAISFDSRINSDIFTVKVAEVFASNGIKAYITRELQPTPFLSYITRQYKADIGVMITASHNPAKYNGYKVYGSDGCQLTDDGATEMIGYIEKIDPFNVKTKTLDEYIKSGLIEYVADDMTAKYLAEVTKQSLGDGNGVKVAYSPLNGTGYKLVPAILKSINVSALDIVPEQGYPDGNFTTCSFPNPEKPEALKLGLALAAKAGSDILIATDPDADRIGTAVLHNGSYRLMSGNEIGVLLTDFVLSSRKIAGTLPKNPVVVKTIVTSKLGERVALEYGATVYNVLTGFKYIGDIIGKLEAKNEADRFVIGFEESYGYLCGSYVRDKDAVVAAMLVAQMTAYYKRLGKTLVDRIEEIYAKFGTYEHRLKSYEYAGAAGNAKMKELLAGVRDNIPTSFGGSRVSKYIDYLTQTEFDLPPANVLEYNLEDGNQLIIRPSGTEPLIKLYITACHTIDENKVTFEKIAAELEQLFNC